MLMFVRCAHCGTAGRFDVRLVYTVRRESCGACGHERETEWSFQFCGLECFRRWLATNDAAVRGVPCQDCRDLETGQSTGHLAGLKEQGACPTCKGRLRLGAKMEGKPT